MSIGKGAARVLPDNRTWALGHLLGHLLGHMLGHLLGCMLVLGHIACTKGFAE